MHSVLKLFKLTAASLAFWSAAAAAQVGSPEKAAPAPIFSQPGARLAVCGDSITEQHFYCRFIELYLTMCVPELKVRQCHWGKGGDTARNFSLRMDNSLREFQPTVVTLCYGMNDGLYKAFDPAAGKIYGDSLRAMVNSLVAKGATVIVGGPGVVDSRYYTRGGGANPAGVYNQTLGQFDAIARSVAAEAKMPHAEVYGTVKATMEKAKVALGTDFSVGGNNGGPCRPNGQLVMAYAFLKAMGLNGDLGTITVDLKGASAATGGHKVLASEGGRVEVESTRYPFCFTGDGKSAEGTRSILPYLPFNQELNRLTLVVRNLGAERGQVTWGGGTNVFSRQELEQGINLAAAFPENLFSAPFARVLDAVGKKQEFDAKVNRAIAEMPAVVAPTKGNAKGMAAIEVARQRLWHNDSVQADNIAAAVVPVKHTLEVRPAL